MIVILHINPVSGKSLEENAGNSKKPAFAIVLVTTEQFKNARWRDK